MQPTHRSAEAFEQTIEGLVAAMSQCRQLLQTVETQVADLREARAQAEQLRQLAEQENVYLKDEIKADQNFASLIGDSPPMQQVRAAILQVARTDSNVLILGETGTGKELIARAIHKISRRREHLLVKVNCAAMAPGVIASELFGHEPGALTGAKKRRLGRFEVAHQGSIFLDEVGEIPLETQVLLLRVLQERMIERVGGNDSIAVDVRVIAATHRDLQELAQVGRFRADLYYRLNVFPLQVPPLRQRKEDISALVEHFVRHFARRMNRPIRRVEPSSMELLMDYSWPGNIRELENILERAIIVAPGEELHVDPTWLSSPEPATCDGDSLHDVERRAILEALTASGGKVYGAGGAAQKLGLKPSTLYGKMRRVPHRARAAFLCRE